MVLQTGLLNNYQPAKKKTLHPSNKIRFIVIIVIIGEPLVVVLGLDLVGLTLDVAFTAGDLIVCMGASAVCWYGSIPLVRGY